MSSQIPQSGTEAGPSTGMAGGPGYGPGGMPPPFTGPTRLMRWVDLLWLVLIVFLSQFVPGLLVGLWIALKTATGGAATVNGALFPPMLVMVAVAGSGIVMIGGAAILRRARNISWFALGFQQATTRHFAITIAVFLAYLVLSEAITRAFGIDPEGQMARELLIDFVPDEASVLHILLAVAGIGVFVPVAEEIIFRGLLVTWLRERVGPVAGVILSALAFSVAHLYFLITDVTFGIFITGQIFVLGLMLATLYVWSRSLWPPILLHIVNNTLAIVVVVAGS